MNDIQRQLLKAKAIKIFDNVFSDYPKDKRSIHFIRESFLSDIEDFCLYDDLSEVSLGRLLSTLTREVVIINEEQRSKIIDKLTKFIDELRLEIEKFKEDQEKTRAERAEASGGAYTETSPGSVIKGPWGEKK